MTKSSHAAWIIFDPLEVALDTIPDANPVDNSDANPDVDHSYKLPRTLTMVLPLEMLLPLTGSFGTREPRVRAGVLSILVSH